MANSILVRVHRVAAIIVFIIVAASGCWVSNWPPRVFRTHTKGGFGPYGWGAIFAGITTVIFSMVGAEIVTVAAAESAESNRTMSRLAATVVLRILLFYVLSILLILCIVPWTEFKSGDSSFALALERIGIPSAATIMNVIVLTAVLSCLNSGVYVTARVLLPRPTGDATLATNSESCAHPAGQLLASGDGLNWIAPGCSLSLRTLRR
jgi:L-asparagine transporter-like permease